MDTIKEVTFTHRYWVILLPLILIGADIIAGWIQLDSTNPYMKGDKVTHSDKAWISDVDNNVWEREFMGGLK